eukprot:gnl/Chilomastix_cuspidata/3340.p1 GENE.gnl/Chilomastix_cuspidata/3340~~gnl/Chilomastix_cuspidata/3340.p1  ORF type:complete len:1183 (-),score=41.11 gnl/Chilomastix_cuspidata/3340:33-3581(-)
MTNEMKIASIYAQFSGDSTPTAEEMYPYLEMAENFGSAAATAKIIEDGTLGDLLFGNTLSNADKVTTVFQGLFGRDPLQAGLDYWVDQLENNSGYVNPTSMAQAILRGAEANDDQTDWNNITATASDLAADLADYTPAPVEEDGESYDLTDGRDNLTGTDGNDTFYAEVGQNSAGEGSIANAFATGDIIDGGAGSKDTLEAAIMNDNEVDGADADAAINAKTTNLEIAKFTVLDEEAVTVDAGRMDSVEEFWSVDSDNTTLTIEDVRLGSKLSITDDLSFGMESVDFDSSLTAQLDSQAFVKDADDKLNSQIVIEVGDSNKAADATDPLELIELAINFTFGGQVYSLDLESADGTYEGLKTAVEEALAAEGLTGLNVTYGADLSEITAENDTVPLLYSGAKQIIITDPEGTEFTNFTSGVGAKPSVQSSNPVSNTTANAPQSSTPLIETNILLDDAGRGSMAGDFQVGGMSNSDKGIEKFDVYVDRDSSIASLTTTNNKLQEIEINSKDFDNDANTTATGSLEIGATQAGLTLIEADAFNGTALKLGTVTAINNLVQLDASIAGDVTFVGSTTQADGIDSDNAYDYDTGAGNDSITFTLDGDSVDTIGESFSINAGNGNNTVKVDMQGAGVSVATTDDLNNLTITTGSGVDKVELIGGSSAGAKEVFTLDLADTLAISDGSGDTTLAFDGDTINFTDGDTQIEAAAAIAAGTFTNYDAVDNGDGTVTFTAKIAGATPDVAITDFTFTPGSEADTDFTGTVTVDTQGVTAAASVDGDADFNISTGAESDFVYINSIDDDQTTAAAKGQWTVGTNTGPSTNVVYYKAELTVNFAGFEETVVINTTAANNFVATQVEINEAIQAAIKANPELARLLTTDETTGTQEMNISSTVEGNNELNISIVQPNHADAVIDALTPTELTAIKTGLIATGEAADSTAVDTSTKITTLLNDNDTATVTGTGTNGSSANETNVTNISTIDLGKGANDLVVLNSHDNSANTIVFSDNWDKVSVVNFEDVGDILNAGVTGNHILDFTNWLTSVTDPSVSNGNGLSEQEIGATIAAAAGVAAGTALTENQVHIVTGFTETTTDTWDSMTGNDILTAINGGALYANLGDAVDSSADVANLVGDTQYNIILIENANNLGEYKAVYLTATDDTNTADFATAEIIGTIDFGDSVDLATANLA